MSAAIRLTNLSKSFQAYDRREGVWGSVKDLFSRDYRTVHAVDSISFEVGRGELIGYIGPNGAGKSTSIKMLTGILKPTSGEVEVLGFKPYYERKRYAQHIGVVFGQRTQLWWDIAVIESFRLLGQIYQVPRESFESRLATLSGILELGPLLRTPVRKLSLGQRMRCDLAASLLHAPEVLFLDEPTIGLDAMAKDSIRTFLRQINREFGTTIILTTHDLKEIEELCKRIIVLDKGKILYDGELARVKTIPGLPRHIRIDFPGPAPLVELESLFAGQASFEREGERRLVGRYDPEQIATSDLLRTLLGRFEVGEVSVAEPDIEQVIMKLYRDGAGVTA